MATFTWIAGTTGRWSVAGNWDLTGGIGTAPPGGNSAGIDVAILGATNAAYTVTINTGDEFDVAELDITGKSANKATSLSISGSLITNTLSYGGQGGDALITVASGGLLNIQNGLAATFLLSKSQILTIAGTGSGAQVSPHFVRHK